MTHNMHGFSGLSFTFVLCLRTCHACPTNSVPVLMKGALGTAAVRHRKRCAAVPVSPTRSSERPGRSRGLRVRPATGPSTRRLFDGARCDLEVVALLI